MKNLANSILLSVLLISSFAFASASSFPKAANETFTTLLAGQNVTQDIYYYTQVLDHFNLIDNRVWQQRYSVYDEYFNATNGTVFIYIGGESALKGINTGWVIQLCKKFQAMAIGIEHRFYGASQPFGQNQNSYSVENLRYLNANQALEDLAQFISNLKQYKQYGITSRHPIITIGGSYPGALSAWMRSKYPHLVAGALASSAVINAIEDFDGYDYQVYLSTSRSGDWCPKNIQKFNNLIETNRTLFSQAVKAFNAESLSELEFFQYFTTVESFLVQYGYRQILCDFFQNTTFDYQLTQLSYIGQDYYPPQDSTSLKNTYYDENKMSRQYLWQQCTEFGWFGTPNKISPMKSKRLDVNYFKKFCQDIFGKDLQGPNTRAVNAIFGGLQIQGSKIVFTNGDEDGWKQASLMKSTAQFESIVCEGCGHCTELVEASDNDSQSLKNMRSRVEKLLGQWISDYKYQNIFQNLNKNR